MSLTTYFPLISFFVVFSLGFFVWFKKKTDRVNFTFALFSLVISVWMFGTFMMFLNKDNHEAIIFWDKFVYISVVFIPVIMIHFGFALTKDVSKFSKWILSVGYTASSLFLILIPTKLFVNDVFIYKWGAHSKAQFFHHLFLFYFIVYLVLWFILVYKYYKETKFSIEKERVKYCFLAFIILALMGSFGYLPAYGIAIYPFAYISGLIFCIILAYTIVVHRLMDIKLVMRRSSVFLTSLTVILLIAIAVEYLVALYFVELTTLFDFLILVAAVYYFPILRKYFYKVANKYFFSSLYDSREVIAELSEKLRSTLEASLIYEYISETLENAFHSTAVGVLIFNEKKGEYVTRYNKGFTLGEQRAFAGEKKLHQLFIGQNKPIVVEEIKQGNISIGSAGKKTIKLLEKLKVEILTPLNIKDRTIGLIALGSKESGDMYNEEDLQVLEVVGAQVAIAIENAILFEEQKNFNVKLEKEVEKATHDLKKANAQLIKLDEAKSEFISIASHQLRTPLTVVKGYISMILEKNFGEVAPRMEDPLDKIYESNNRLIKLVENLLNVSRIESGRVQFESKKMQLEDLVVSVVEELMSSAQKKKIKLIYKKSKNVLPEIKIDEEKIRQVVMNLIDNAIKYTKKGSVTVDIRKRDDKIRFCVADSGMGIDPKDLINLFKKFHRGEGTVLIHTEGTGLGLYVARNMLNMHKGKIWAESKGVGKGSKFCFEIPIV